jgi:hypothetical protein
VWWSGGTVQQTQQTTTPKDFTRFQEMSYFTTNGYKILLNAINDARLITEDVRAKWTLYLSMDNCT